MKGAKPVFIKGAKPVLPVAQAVVTDAKGVEAVVKAVMEQDSVRR